MSIYAIGDLQGCYSALRRLLDKLEFDDQNDQLWFTGDLVNRGPESLETLRFVKALGKHAISVLGNHDMHLLAAHITGNYRRARNDTLETVLLAKDRDELIDWLRHRPFIHHDDSINTVMVHAGIPRQWTIKKALRQSRKLERILHSEQADQLLLNMYAGTPPRLEKYLTKIQRRKYALAAFTRMRYVTHDGDLEFSQKGAPGSQKKTLKPWFEAPCPRWHKQARIVFGHWSTLGKLERKDVISLDGGCVWGGQLIAAKLTAKSQVEYTEVSCKT